MKLSDLELRLVRGRQYPDPQVNPATEAARHAGEPRRGVAAGAQERTLKFARRDAARLRRKL